MVVDLAILEIMVIPLFKPKLPEIAESEQTPLVRSLLQRIAEQQEQIQRLTDEVRRLKGGPPRPQRVGRNSVAYSALCKKRCEIWYL